MFKPFLFCFSYYFKAVTSISFFSFSCSLFSCLFCWNTMGFSSCPGSRRRKSVKTSFTTRGNCLTREKNASSIREREEGEKVAQDSRKNIEGKKSNGELLRESRLEERITDDATSLDRNQDRAKAICDSIEKFSYLLVVEHEGL